jgi:hypothetical protein
MKDSSWNKWKWAIIALHFILALGYNFATPYRTAGYSNGVYLGDMGAPDELAHTVYIEELIKRPFIAPVLTARGGEADYQFHQAPLFYALNAGWSRLAGFESLDSVAAGRWSRALNGIFGALFVWGAFSLARRLTNRLDVAVCACAVVAFLPMNVALSGAVSNDPLLFMLCTWSLAFAVGAEKSRDFWLAGICAGLAFWTKTSALALLPMLAICTWRSWRTNKLSVVSLLLIPLALAGVWWFRNYQVYGDPLAQNIFLERFKPDAPEINGLLDFAKWGYGILRPTGQSLIGQFGYMDISTPLPLVLVGLLLMAILLALSLRTRVQDKRNLPLVIFTLAVIVLYLRFNLTYAQPQARYCFAALAPLAYFLSRPLLDGKKWVWGLPAFLLVTSLVNLSRLPGEFHKRVAQLEQAREQGLLKR